VRSNGQLIVRTTVEPELVADLVEFVRSVRGRAALDGAARFSVPVPAGVDEHTAYRELSMLLARWEARHPDVRVEIVSRRPTSPGPDERRLNAALHGAIKEGWRTKSD
jgi:hypothetical protein